MQLVLASQSPRRIQLLTELQLDFIVDPSQFSEKDHHISPKDLVIHNAAGKAKDIASKHSNSIIIAADTIGVIHNQPLNKPKDRDDARRLIKLISGTPHHVITGLHLIKTDSQFKTIQEIQEQVTTEVTMSPLSDREIESYLDTNDWHDKAAAYAIQGKGAIFVESIKGDYFNVVGLPINTLSKLLKQLGIAVI